MKSLTTVLTSFLCASVLVACEKKGNGDESDHKIAMPPSAKNIQNRGNSDSVMTDRGIATILEFDQKDIEAFIKQLKVTKRSKPDVNVGDPTVNGWNVWPKAGQTFVPGNKQYSGFKKTWDKNPTPEEMLSCQSPAGDWLHVEIWRFSDTKLLLKIYTDWN
jgi:hypothetical protein